MKVFVMPILGAAVLLLRAPLPAQADQVFVDRCNMSVGGSAFQAGLRVTKGGDSDLVLAGTQNVPAATELNRATAIAWAMQTYGVAASEVSYRASCPTGNEERSKPVVVAAVPPAPVVTPSPAPVSTPVAPVNPPATTIPGQPTATVTPPPPPPAAPAPVTSTVAPPPPPPAAPAPVTSTVTSPPPSPSIPTPVTNSVATPSTGRT